jgi:hypothetical protein
MATILERFTLTPEAASCLKKVDQMPWDGPFVVRGPPSKVEQGIT